MLNEWQEFLDYTGAVTYTAAGKNDMTYLGRFTFDTLLDFEGLARVLTSLARGYLFHEADGSILQGNPRSRIDYTDKVRWNGIWSVPVQNQRRTYRIITQ